MRINIKATNIELTDAIQEYLDKKIEGLDEMVDTPESEAVAQVELGKTTHHHKSGDIFRAEINVRVQGKPLRAVSETDDLYSAIDDMRDEIWRDVMKYKTKRRSLLRRGGHRMKEMMHGLFRKRNK